MRQPRFIAANILRQIDQGVYTLDHLLNKCENQIHILNRHDRSLLHAIVFGVLRWQQRLDWIIDQLTAQKKKIDPTVRIILRIGLFQLCFLKRIPVSAAVNTSVELSKSFKRQWAAGFVNGLLRQAIRHDDQIKWPDKVADPSRFLSITQSMPRWLVDRWIIRWGFETTQELCHGINTIPSISLRVNTLKVSRKALALSIQNQVDKIEPTHFSPDGLIFEHPIQSIAHWQKFQHGFFQIQSEAAQIVSRCLAPQPGESIWDACAGLGTKTAHIAQLMNNQGKILATDLSMEKLKQLDAEMDRLGITIVKTRQMDLRLTEGKKINEKFDKILLDAPCSGLGVLQKNPDGKWRCSPKDILFNAEKQLILIGHAVRYLKPKGILVYAVCSLEPEETEQVVDAFLQNHSEFAIHPFTLENIVDGDQLLTPRGFFTTIPHLHNMDGFFATALTQE